MKSRVLQFFVLYTQFMLNCHNGIFFKHGGQAGGDRNKPFKSSLCEAHKDISTEQIREWIYTGSILGGSGSQSGIQAPLGAPRPFEGFQEIKTICIITLRYYLPFSLY